MELLKIDESQLTPDVWKLSLDGVVDPSNATALWRDQRFLTARKIFRRKRKRSIPPRDRRARQ